MEELVIKAFIKLVESAQQYMDLKEFKQLGMTDEELIAYLEQDTPNIIKNFGVGKGKHNIN